MSLSKSQINALFETVERSTLSHLDVCAQKQRTLESISEAVSQRLTVNSPGVKTAVNLILKKLVKEGTVVIESNPQGSDRYFITENILNEAFSSYGTDAYTKPPRSYNSASDSTKAMARAAKRKFKKLYPSEEVRIDSRNGWILVNGKKTINISSASGRPTSIEDMIDRMSGAVSGRSSYGMNEGVLSVTRTPYGMTIEDENEKAIRIGHMVLELLSAGDDDIFNTPQGVSADLLSNLMSQHDKGVQGGMINWDPDVFRDYYDVDLDRVLTLYSRLTNQPIKENPYKE